MSPSKILGSIGVPRQILHPVADVLDGNNCAVIAIAVCGNTRGRFDSPAPPSRHPYEAMERHASLLQPPIQPHSARHPEMSTKAGFLPPLEAAPDEDASLRPRLRPIVVYLRDQLTTFPPLKRSPGRSSGNGLHIQRIVAIERSSLKPSSRQRGARMGLLERGRLSQKACIFLPV